MANPRELLTHFSVTQDEADIYLALLKLGPASVTDLAKKISKNRTATYFHLNKLQEKDIISSINRGRTLVFTAVAPADLAARFDRLTTDFKSLVPQLEALQQIEVDAPRVTVTESRAGYFKVYDDISSLPTGSTFYVIEGAEALRHELTLLTDAETNSFFSKIIARNIATHLILTDDALALPATNTSPENFALLQQRRLSVRTYPSSTLAFTGLTILYGDTLAYLFPQTNLVVTITHPGIAASFQATFNTLFNQGQPYSF